MIFQTELTTLDTELSQLQALLEAKRQQRQQFEELDAETNAAIEMVALLKTKIEAVSSDAIASLKTAVLTLFDSGDNGSDGGNQPTDPTPGPDDDEPELLCFNGLTGECLTTVDIDDEEFPVAGFDEGIHFTSSEKVVKRLQGGGSTQKDYKLSRYACPMGVEWVLSSDAPLTGQTCAIDPDIYWQTSAPDGSSWEFASPLSCLLWEDAPMLEQYCTVTPTDNENKGTEEDELIPQLSSTEMTEEDELIPQLSSTEMTEEDELIPQLSSTEMTEEDELIPQLSSTEMTEEDELIPQLSSTEMTEEDELIPQLSSTEMTEEDELIPQLSSTEMVHTSARTGYLKLKESGQILAAYAWFPRKDLAEAWCDWLDGMSLGSPELRLSQRNSSWKYEIKLTGLSMTQIERLSQEDLSRKPSKKKETPAQAAGIEPPSGWRESQPTKVRNLRTEAQVTTEAPKKARITLESSPYNGHVCDVVEVSHDWWTLATPKGNLKYPADSVESVDEGVQMAENRQEAEAIAFEFGDVAEVIADLNDTHLIGSFGKVKFAKDGRIALEVDEQVVLFQPSELQLKVKAEAPTPQQKSSPPTDVSLSDQDATYLQTEGNYLGLAKQTRQRWEQAEINPSDLIADMKTKRPAEPAWDAARYNPVLAAISSEYDF